MGERGRRLVYNMHTRAGAAHGTAGCFHVHPSLACILFAQGIDLIWESVGGDMFTTCTRALAQHMVLLEVFMSISH